MSKDEEEPVSVQRSGKISSATAINRLKDAKMIKEGKMLSKKDFNLKRKNKLKEIRDGNQ